MNTAGIFLLEFSHLAHFKAFFESHTYLNILEAFNG